MVTLFHPYCPLSQDAVYGRRPLRVTKTRQYFLRFTDRWTRLPFEELAIELLRVNRFLQLQLVGRRTELNALKIDDDDPIFILYHGDAPESMLDVFKLIADPEFALGGECPTFLVYLAIENLTCFMYRKMPTLEYLPLKLFRDLQPELRELLLILKEKSMWFEGLAVIRMLGIAAFQPYTSHWLTLNENADIFEIVCRHMYRGREIVDEIITILKMFDNMTTLLLLHRNWDDSVAIARLVGTQTCTYAVFAFYNVMKWSVTDFDVYLGNAERIRRAEVFPHFFHITKQLMIWPTPGQFLNYFLFGVRRCLDMDGVVSELFLNNAGYGRKQKTPRGIESLKYWNHSKIRPTALGWLICHALSLNEVYGTCASIQILTHVLVNFRDPVVSFVIETIGPELLDLAHLIKYTTELKDEVTVQEIPVQTPILEALLRHGGMSHIPLDKSNTFEGTLIVQLNCTSLTLYQQTETT